MSHALMLTLEEDQCKVKANLDYRVGSKATWDRE